MTEEISPTMRGRRLRAELRKLRDESKLTIEAVARQLDWSASKVSRLETGQRGVHPSDVRLLSDVYGVTGERREKMIEMARQSRKHSWWHEFRDTLPEWMVPYLDIESETKLVRTYAEELIPSLLQTEGYAGEVDPADVQRVRRERFAENGAPPLHAVLSEAALRRLVGGRAVLRDQLAHLTKLADLPHVTLQILTFEAGAHPAMADPFTLLSFDDHGEIVYLGHQTGAMYLEKHSETDRYTAAFELLERMALDPEESTRFILGLADTLG